MRMFLELALKAGGYSVLNARDGREALDLARQAHPDVILLDLAMPVLDGLGFRTEQLEDRTIAAIPVICISGRQDAVSIAKSLHIEHCVLKPFDPDVVVEHVREVLRLSA